MGRPYKNTTLFVFLFLFLTPPTATTTLQRTMKKLGLTNRGIFRVCSLQHLRVEQPNVEASQIEAVFIPYSAEQQQQQNQTPKMLYPAYPLNLLLLEALVDAPQNMHDMIAPTIREKAGASLLPTASWLSLQVFDIHSRVIISILSRVTN